MSCDGSLLLAPPRDASANGTAGRQGGEGLVREWEGEAGWECRGREAGQGGNVGEGRQGRGEGEGHKHAHIDIYANAADVCESSVGSGYGCLLINVQINVRMMIAMEMRVRGMQLMRHMRLITNKMTSPSGSRQVLLQRRVQHRSTKSSSSQILSDRYLDATKERGKKRKVRKNA